MFDSSTDTFARPLNATPRSSGGPRHRPGCPTSDNSMHRSTRGCDMAEPLRRELVDGVLRLTLDRPDQMNALDTALVSALGEAVRSGGADPAVRVVQLTGSGRAFCAGADLTEAADLTQDGARFGAWLGLWRATFDAIEGLAKPTVALLNGLTL